MSAHTKAEKTPGAVTTPIATEQITTSEPLPNTPPSPPLDLSALVEAVRIGFKEAYRDEASLIDYSELAERMKLSERMVRRLKNAGLIRPALDLGKTVRFHWPSVLEQLREGRYRDRRRR